MVKEVPNVGAIGNYGECHGLRIAELKDRDEEASG